MHFYFSLVFILRYHLYQDLILALCYAARDNLIFLQHWFTKFSEYKNNEFFITGESYAGKEPLC